MIGIVAEYNPFHEGHKYHIDNSSDGCVVAVMSGDFVQRGEAAIFDKYSRAEQACKNGVNLVIELPLPWCISSAEIFAKGAVHILESVGVDKISFGSECGDIAALYNLSELSKSALDEIKLFMSKNPDISFPVARRHVIDSDLLDFPNNSLGIEYIKHATVPCITVKRNSVHDGYGSAKELRQELKSFGLGVDYRLLETAIISRLISFDKNYYNTLPDSDDGVGNRLFEAVRKGKSLQQIYELTKTKSITMSAVRRLAMCAALGVNKSYFESLPTYGRVLAFDSVGREVLKAEHKIPLITNGSDINKLDNYSRKLFALCSSANDLYNMAINNGNQFSCGNDYRKNAFIV